MVWLLGNEFMNKYYLVNIHFQSSTKQNLQIYIIYIKYIDTKSHG